MRAIWVVLGVLWLGAVSAGLATLAAYDNTPGAAARAPRRWPAGSRLTLDTSRPTLVMVAHPRCSCTWASLGEMAELMARVPQRPRAYVVLVAPGRAGATRGWDHTDLREQAARIPDVTVVADDGGREAALYGAETSGSTFLFGPDGVLLFSGGTTGARGHAGDNAGRRTLLALLTRGTAARSATEVFGCALFSEGDRDGPAASHEATHAHPHTN
jgi:hypothetical protein